MALLTDDGKLAFTFIDPGGELPGDDPRSPADHRLWAYLNFCTATHMNQLLPNAQIRPPNEPDRQHCAIAVLPHVQTRPWWSQPPTDTFVTFVLLIAT